MSIKPTPPKIIYTITTFILLLVLTITSCRKDEVVTVDITQKKWTLISVTYDGQKQLPEKSYILEFENDSAFIMPLSANFAGGKYKIQPHNSIQIHKYHAYTKVCCDNAFSMRLQKAFLQVTSFYMESNKLIFKGLDGEVEFE